MNRSLTSPVRISAFKVTAAILLKVTGQFDQGKCYPQGD
jgi:hypothetical protein